MAIQFTPNPDKSTPDRMVNFINSGATPETEKICVDFLKSFMEGITGDGEELTTALFQVDKLELSSMLKIWLASKLTECYLTQGLAMLTLKNLGL